MILFLDSSPLSALVNPSKSNPEVYAFNRWVDKAIKDGYIVSIPEISYYEVRRELVRAKRNKSVRRIDRLCLLAGSPNFYYIPISTDIIVKATQLWAEARWKGLQTASDDALDGDVILAATAITVSLDYSLGSLVVTPNVRHIGRYNTPAKYWKDITL